MQRRAALLAAMAAAAQAAGAADDGDVIGYGTIEAAIAALRADPTAQFETQQGWTVVASREGPNPVQWFFTPADHPAHPAVVKRTALEHNGTGLIELGALCYGPEHECFMLIDGFRQQAQAAAQAALPQEVLLDVGIALDDHERVRVSRLLAQEGQAAEIRMDDVLKVVIVPTFDDKHGVLLWTAVYEFDGDDYRLVAEPKMAAPGNGTADIVLASDTGTTFRFVITPLVAAR